MEVIEDDKDARIRELEMFIGLIAAAFGLNAHEGRWQIRLTLDTAFKLREKLGGEPSITIGYDDGYYLADVVTQKAVA